MPRRCKPPFNHRPNLRQASKRVAQRGAMGLLGVLTVLLAFSFAALAIDTGRLWVARQDMQHAADLAALAAARHNGCGTTANDARERAAASAKQFGVDIAQPGVTLSVTRGNLVNAVDSGVISKVFIAGAEPSDTTTAAKVLLKKTVRKSLLMGGFAGQTIELSAVATAQGEAPKATLSVGTRFGITQQQADFISKLFAGILGNSDLTLTSGSLNNLATSVVNLEALRIAAGAASLNELLNRQVTVTELLRWISTASTNIDATGQQALQSIITASAGNGKLKLRVGDVLNVQTPAPDGVATANINVLDLVTVGLQVANKDALITLNAGVAGVTSIRIKLLSLPKIAVGNKGRSAVSGAWCTSAQMAQVDALIGLDTTGLPSLKLPFVAEVTVIADLALHLRAGGVNAHLIDLVADSSGGQAKVETLSSLINIDLSNNAGTGPARVAVSINLVGGLLPIKEGVRVGLKVPAQETQGSVMTLNVPAPVRKNMPQRTDRGTNLGDTLSTALRGSELTLEAEGLLSGLLNIVLAWLNPLLKGLIDGLVTPLLTNIVVPLLDVLGFGVNGVSVELTDIVAPQPQLKI
ncbi:MAG: hypothetical protein RJB60_2440 [Pseudomonadota bacterium]|jgi:uncharacterized membrane protein